MRRPIGRRICFGGSLFCPPHPHPVARTKKRPAPLGAGQTRAARGIRGRTPDCSAQGMPHSMTHNPDVPINVSLDAPFDEAGTCLFEDRLTGHGGWLFARPEGVIEALTPAEVRPALERISAAQSARKYLAGYMSYEAGYALEPRLTPLHRAAPSSPNGLALPLLRFYVYGAATPLDGRATDQLVSAAAGKAGHRILPPAPGLTRADYEPLAERTLAYIRAGDIYQANLTFPLRGRIMGDPLSLYAALRSAQPVSHGAFLTMEDGALVSLSPELFVARTGAHLVTRPMKGTAPRGGSPADDELRRRALRADPKERAENLMIVDLLRNDLSRVCTPGSVTVRNLFEVETYPTLHTMTSTVEGELRPGQSSANILAALFPCGSVTGTPKIRAQEIIGELEAGPRGAYTGAIGYLLPGGDFSFNVAIRTLTAFRDGTYVYPVGGGIVADSDPAREYDEALLKGRVLTNEAAPFGLIETIAWSAAEGFDLLDRHMERLARSAKHFHRPFDATTTRDALARAVAHAPHPRLRVRLVLDEAGAPAIEIASLTDLPTPLPFVIADNPVDAADPYLRHKTTRRAVFEAELARAQMLGAREAVFENQYGEITEGAWTNVFVEREGQLLTPPQSAGLLPGTLRADLLADGRAVEHALTREDLLAADALYLGNSVRGLMPAQLLTPAQKETAASLAQPPS